MRRKFTLIILLLLIGCSFAFAQNIKVSGKVSDKDGAAISGVSVKVKGTTAATSTDITGQYQITASPDATLIFSFVGYFNQEIAVKNRTTIDVVLQDETKALNDVVVIGYGSQKSEKVTGAISSLKSTDIEKVNAVRIEDAIQGRVSGVEIIQNGSPGVNTYGFYSRCTFHTPAAIRWWLLTELNKRL